MAFPSNSWVDMEIRNHLSSHDNLTLANAHLNDGAFREWGNTTNELLNNDVNKIVAKPNHLVHIAASGGEEGSADGTSGSYDIYDKDTKVCHVSWMCPPGRAAPNVMEISDRDERYNVECKGAELDPGPIGHVSIRIHDA
ncbi:uncharacterized protein DNG_09027 [Cephalotrichum gorgonifer]|uniref:Uncharacterized protein n=1 Tax=Cephalotrichum gorgonifer TaxID=2041049 RepID=A0AAE8N720_9PEZI|nr:uncharacterized protein DNG_09027 [Cephalotrichum gorgonifer]